MSRIRCSNDCCVVLFVIDAMKLTMFDTIMKKSTLVVTRLLDIWSSFEWLNFYRSLESHKLFAQFAILDLISVEDNVLIDKLNSSYKSVMRVAFVSSIKNAFWFENINLRELIDVAILSDFDSLSRQTFVEERS